MACRMADSMGSWTIASKSPCQADNTARPTSRISTNLARALSSSTRACAENIRLSPASGFIRLNLGAMASAENSQPPREMGPRTEAASKIIMKGNSDSAAACAEAPSHMSMLRSSISTSRGKAKLPRMISSMALPILPPNSSSAPNPPKVTARVLSSLERAICPFSRDSRRRFSVGSSLLSAPLSDSAIA